MIPGAPPPLTRLAPLTRPEPLGDAVDEQVDDGVLGKIALAEAFVFGPQPFGDLAHRSPRQKPAAPLVGERVLDVARRQTPRIELDRQTLERLGPPQKRRPHVRDERLGRVADLRRRVFHRALRRLHLARQIAVRMMSFVKALLLLHCATSGACLPRVRRLAPSTRIRSAGPTQVPNARRASNGGMGSNCAFRVFPQRLYDHTSTPDVTGPSSRDDLFNPASGCHPAAIWRQLAQGLGLHSATRLPAAFGRRR